MINFSLLSCYSIITPIAQVNFLGKHLNKKKLECLQNALKNLEQVSSELEEKINGCPSRIDNLALRLLDVVECRKLIQSQSFKPEMRLDIVCEKLNQVKEHYEERINGQKLDIEEIKITFLNIAECKSIITNILRPIKAIIC